MGSDDYPFARAGSDARAQDEELLRARQREAEQRRAGEQARLDGARELLAQHEHVRAAQAYWELIREGVRPHAAMAGLIATMQPRIAPFDATVRGLLWVGDLNTGKIGVVAAFAMIVLHKLDFLSKASDGMNDLFTLLAIVVIPPLYFSWVATTLAMGLLSLRRTGRASVPLHLQRAGRLAALAVVVAIATVVRWWQTDQPLWLLDAVAAIAVAVAAAGASCIPDPLRRRVYLGWIAIVIALAIVVAVLHASDPAADVLENDALVPAVFAFMAALFSPAIATRMGGEPHTAWRKG
ncbi:MAG TPA: hypothetical protein VG755_43745 [Nannocystaceae bacterium]|nr:hypothetical protein [Nannocystaceae bacterium]